MLGSCRVMKASRGVCEHLLEVLQPPIGRRQGRYEFLNAGLAWNEVFDAALLQNRRLQVEHIRQRFFAVRCCDAADRLCCSQHFFVKVDTACDTPTASAAFSLVIPVAISFQNRRSISFRCDGAPGERIAPRPVNFCIHPAGRPINTSKVKGVATTS